jgi:hypothetical protein
MWEMRKIICCLLIVLILPIPELLAQSEESTQTQETQTQETNKQATETPNPKTVVSPEENPFEEFISPPYTCMFCRVYAGTLLQDAKHVVIFPTWYDQKRWLLFGGAVGSLFVISAFDDNIQESIQRNRNNVTDKAANIINPFGFQAAYAVIAGIYLQGVFAHNPKSKVVALDAIAASVVSPAVRGHRKMKASIISIHFPQMAKTILFHRVMPRRHSLWRQFCHLITIAHG